MNYKLSPSDFTFLWEECRRCFYLKVVNGFPRPMLPFPKMFTRIDGMQKKFFAGASTDQISPELPPGNVVHGEKWVESTPIRFEGVADTCFLKGKTDTIVEFEDGGFGVIDFKTAEPKGEHIPLYFRQLHAYAYALENAADRALSLKPVSRLGLLCIDHQVMSRNAQGRVCYECDTTWIDFPRRDATFLQFIREVLETISSPNAPPSSPTCTWCEYRDKVRRTGL